jgi:biopolymer transport protein ExbD
MALSLQTGDDASDDGWMAEINTTPLVDVMLVLLIIFLLTIPVVSASVQLNLPVQSFQQQDTSSDYVIVSIDRAGQLFLNDSAVASVQELAAQLAPVAAPNAASGASGAPRVQLQIRADGDAPYSAVAPVIDMAQGLGLAQVSLLTQPAAPATQGAARSR